MEQKLGLFNFSIENHFEAFIDNKFIFVPSNEIILSLMHFGSNDNNIEL